MDYRDIIAGAVKRVPGGSGRTNISKVTAGLATPTRAPVTRSSTWKRQPIPSNILQGAMRRDPSVQPITRTASQMQTITRQLGQQTVSRQLPTSRGAPTSSYVTQLTQSSISRLPTGARLDIGGIARPLPIGRNVVSPIAGDRTGVLPPSTLATQGAFGGETGGMGAAAAVAPTSGADLGLGGIGESVSSFGSGIVNTVKEYIPLAIKVVLAVIVIKIVLWLLRGRR